MAKESMKNRELKRQQTVAKYAAKRAELKTIISSPHSTPEQRWEALGYPAFVAMAVVFDLMVNKPDLTF